MNEYSNKQGKPQNHFRRNLNAYKRCQCRLTVTVDKVDIGVHKCRKAMVQAL